MTKFLKFLVYKIDTIDGITGSALSIIPLMTKQIIKFNKNKEEKDFEKIAKEKISKKIYFKYFMIKVRSKLAYMAMQQKLTIVELFLNAILRSINKFIKNGCLPPFEHT